MQIEVLKTLDADAGPIPFDTLQIESVDLNIANNSSANSTEAYEYQGLVVRRGNSFTIDVTTSKPFPSGTYVQSYEASCRPFQVG